MFGVQKVTISNNSTLTESSTKIISLNDNNILHATPHEKFDQIAGPRSGHDGDSCSMVGDNGPIPSQRDCDRLLNQSQLYMQNLTRNRGNNIVVRAIRLDIRARMLLLKEAKSSLETANSEYQSINNRHSINQDLPRATRENEAELLAQLIAKSDNVKCKEEKLIEYFLNLRRKVRR